jgi:hypothetical protein
MTIAKTTLQILAVATLVVAVLAAPAAQAGVAATTTGNIDQIQRNEQGDFVVFGPDRSNVIDQNQPNGPAYMAGFSQGDLAQSFMQSVDNISGAGILLQPGVGGTDNVTIQLWTGLPNAGGVMLTQASAPGTQGQWVDVFWSAPQAVTPMQTYYLVFVGNQTLGITGALDNPYPYGMVFANAGFMAFPSYDYGFRTYYSDAVATEGQTWSGVKALFN